MSNEYPRRFKGVIAEQADEDFDTAAFLEFSEKVSPQFDRVLQEWGYLPTNPAVAVHRTRMLRELFEWVAREPQSASLVTDSMILTLCRRLLPKPKPN